MALKNDKDLFNSILMPLTMSHPTHSFNIVDINMEANMVMDHDNDEEIGDVLTCGLKNFFYK